MTPVKAKYIGIQDMYDGRKEMLFNLLEDIGDGSVFCLHSTYTRNTLERAGYTPVDDGEKKICADSLITERKAEV